MRTRHRYALLAAFATLFSLQLFTQRSLAQSAIPDYHVYDAEDINGNPLILCAAQDQTGTLYFGTSRGVLQFDGSSWSLHPTPTSVKALAVLEIGRILVGGAADFGILQPSKSGNRMEYKSYRNSLKQGDRDIFRVEKIFTSGKTGYYFAANRLVRANFEGREPQMKLFGIADGAGAMMIDGRVYVNTYDKGLQQIQNNKVVAAPSGEALINQYIAGAARAGNRHLIFTEAGKVYSYSGGAIDEIDTELPAGLNILSVAKLSDGNIAVATFNNGTYLMDENGDVELALNR
ncbi:MAG: hypothetical protein ACOCZ8_04130, partial [Bacteroidota bacterium]